jgi:hypothetical protein
MCSVPPFVDTERQVLQSLCQGGPESRANLNKLRSYRWSGPVHQVIFDLLAELQGADRELIGELLPARLTRRGFPDFDPGWFQPQPLNGKEIALLIDRLLGPGIDNGRVTSRRLVKGERS